MNVDYDCIFILLNKDFCMNHQHLCSVQLCSVFTTVTDASFVVKNALLLFQINSFDSKLIIE